MYDWLTVYTQQRLNDLYRERNRERLVLLALRDADAPPRRPFVHRSLGWLGHNLRTWGETLETRYAPLHPHIAP